MEQIKTAMELKIKIRELELKKMEKEAVIKKHAADMINFVKPVNVLKRTVVNSKIAQFAFSGKSVPASLLQIGSSMLLKKVFKKKDKGN